MFYTMETVKKFQKKIYFFRNRKTTETEGILRF